MSVLANASSHSKDILENYHVASLISPEITALLVVLTELASFGMQEVASVLRPSEGTTMRCSMLVLIAQETSWLQLVLTESQEYIMSSLELAFHCFKDIKMRSQKSLSILRVTRLSQQAATRLVGYGQQTLETRFKPSKVMRMRSFHVLSTTKETLSSLAQRTTPVEFGRIKWLSSKLQSRELRYDRCAFLLTQQYSYYCLLPKLHNESLFDVIKLQYSSLAN